MTQPLFYLVGQDSHGQVGSASCDSYEIKVNLNFQVLAWASASLHCFCTVSDSKVMKTTGKCVPEHKIFKIEIQVAILDREVTRKSSTSNPPNSTSFQVEKSR